MSAQSNPFAATMLKPLQRWLHGRRADYDHEDAVLHQFGRHPRPGKPRKGRFPIRLDLTPKFGGRESNALWLAGFLAIGFVWLAIEGAGWDVLSFLGGLALFVAGMGAWRFVNLFGQRRVVELRDDGVAEIDPRNPGRVVAFDRYSDFEGVTKYRVVQEEPTRAGTVRTRTLLIVELRHPILSRSVPLYIENEPSDEAAAIRRWLGFSDLFGLPVLNEFGAPISDRDRGAVDALPEPAAARGPGVQVHREVQFEVDALRA